MNHGLSITGRNKSEAEEARVGGGQGDKLVVDGGVARHVDTLTQSGTLIVWGHV